MRLKNKLQTPAPAGKKPRHRFSPAKAAYYAFLSFMMFLMTTQPVYATDVWTKATEIMKDVYNQIVLISTVAAIVTASVALLMMNFSRSGRTVDESHAWLKRICITWAILNGLGFIMAEYYPPWEPPVSRFRATRKWYFPPSEPPQHIVAAHIFDFTINLLIVILGELPMQYHQIIYREVFLCLRRQKSEVFWNF